MIVQVCSLLERSNLFLNTGTTFAHFQFSSRYDLSSDVWNITLSTGVIVLGREMESHASGPEALWSLRFISKCKIPFSCSYLDSVGTSGCLFCQELVRMMYSLL